MAGGLDVVDAESDRAVDGGLEVFLVLDRDLLGGNVLPLVLIPHAAAGEDGHLDFGLSETAVFHRAETDTPISEGQPGGKEELAGNFR